VTTVPKRRERLVAIETEYQLSDTGMKMKSIANVDTYLIP